jgi:prepilin-type N-terminal cleavage/methylation domain-containing protein
MKKNSENQKLAFSLIEISVVILIIGILISGISSGIDLYNDFNLSKAKNLTKNSRVNRIAGLELWLETTLDESIKPSQRIHNTNITDWLDINIQNNQKKSTSQSIVAQQPKYILQAFSNSIPALRFDGVNDNFPLDVAFMNKASFTIFAVEQRRSDTNHIYFFGGGSNGVFHMGYATTSLARSGQYGSPDVNFFDYTIKSFKTTEIIPRIHSFILSTTNGKKYWLNGGTNPDKSSKDLSTLTNFSGYVGVTEYGSGTPHFYSGDIAEIIIFSRELNDKERIDVEKYLSNKFNIPLS